MNWDAEIRTLLNKKAAGRRNIAMLPDRRQVKIPRRPAEPKKKIERLGQENQRKCGAITRKGTPCQRKGLGRGGRCPNHGGMSTGPRTQEGKARALKAMQEGLARWRAARARPKALENKKHR